MILTIIFGGQANIFEYPINLQINKQIEIDLSIDNITIKI